MMKQYFSYPIVPAVRENTNIQKVLESKANSVFLLTGDITELKKIIEIFHRASKYVFVHLDLIKGLGKDEAAVKYLRMEAKADGLITTKGNLIDVAKKLDLIPIQRIFLLDSQSIETGVAQVKTHQPEYIEVLPGLLPEVIKLIKEQVKIPIITGGLVKTLNQVKQALNAGALAVSTSEESLWNISF
ncbi:glycerol-3-phosphate responsive antiterminator [Pseudothermotoga thermarum]|uniref:Glycerol-3-phosphate responsive antiterminator, GlpP n=1 Tax=Pseudothermotoga thermarum DSM 5069 TaxID=688269 RepID=F7YYP2_9THEM|nr:glycerol-3-phosphate responsive antiterminator [Pseudothermotoga thermarum]AEH51075.1 glycerol-3-phosphate responsive antiterminator, GlpP [Pseudothermotoga thermarum DSM 5069]